MTLKMNQPEDRLSGALRELASSSRQGASPELGLMLKDAFLHHHVRRRRKRAARMIALATGLIVTASLAWTRWFALPELPKIAAIAAPAEATDNAPKPPPTTGTQISRPVVATKVARRKRGPAATTEANSFFALPSFDLRTTGDVLRIVRVEMPGEDLRMVGAPVTEVLARSRVTADFVVGHDGTPYAVRLVQSSFKAQGEH